MDILTPECAAQSIGPANQLFSLLIQTILAAQCAISPKDMWPKDYGPTAIQQGTFRSEVELCLKIGELVPVGLASELSQTVRRVEAARRP